MRDLTQRKAALRAELERLVTDYYGAGVKVRRGRKKKAPSERG